MKTCRILLVTFYYQPDLSAGSFRTAGLVNALLEIESPTVTIDVLTTLPHRYQSYSRPASERDQDGRVSIRRIKLPVHKNGMVDQARSFAVYAREASRLKDAPKYDLVVGTSGRLMTAALSASIATRLRVPLYLDIRDIFADNAKYLMPSLVAPVFSRLFSWLEQWTCNRAVHINLVSRGFAPYFEARYPGKPLSYLTNGVDDEFFPQVASARAAVKRERPVRVLYAGNLGEAQGLHVTIPPLARHLAGRVEFTVIGDGGRRAKLEEGLAAAGVTSVRIVPPMPRDALIEEYRKADVLFLQLNDYPAFKTVLPSKIFEYAAMGKPIWAGLAGYAADFLRQEVTNSSVFPPCDVEGALAAFERLEIRDQPRWSFIEKHSRRTIMRQMAAQIVAYAGHR